VLIMSTIYDCFQENWLNSSVTRLLNKAYNDFKFLFPDEEPYWQIRCLRQRRKTLEEKISWRSNEKTSKWESVSNKNKAKLFGSPEIIPIIKVDEMPLSVLKKTTKKITKTGVSIKTPSHQNNVRREYKVSEEHDVIELKEELYMKCPFQSGCFSIDLITKEPSELTLVRVGGNRLVTDNLDMWASEQKSALIIYKEKDVFDIPWNSRYAENIASIIDSYEDQREKKLQGSLLIIQSLKQMNCELTEEVKKLQETVRTLTIESQREVKKIETQYKMIIESCISIKKEKITDHVNKIKIGSDVEELIKKTFGDKKPLEIIKSYIEIQMKLNKCKETIAPKLKRINSLNYNNRIKELGFIEMFRLGFEDIWEHLELLTNHEEDYDSDYG
jgi:hypothetical protein